MYYKLVGEPTQVCVTGHIAGAVVGHLLGNVLLRLRDLRSYKTWKKTIWWFSLLMILVLFIGIILINIFYGGSIEDDRIFRMFDIDGDGLINEDELKTTIVSMSNRGKYITDWEVKAIIIDGDLRWRREDQFQRVSNFGGQQVHFLNLKATYWTDLR